MNIGKEMEDIISRHDARVEACGDKLMNAENDMARLLEIMNQYLLPILIAAKKVHDQRDDPKANRDTFSAALANMSRTLRAAGMLPP